MAPNTVRDVLIAVIVAAAIIAVFLVEIPTPSIKNNVNTLGHQEEEETMALFQDNGEHLEGNEKLFPPSEEEESDRLAALTVKLTTPREFAFEESSSPNGSQQLAVHQFLHLHHMKTGGTSMDTYLRCAMERLKNDRGYTVPYGNIHECNKRYYERCKSGGDSRCLKNLEEASIMSYCAPLKDLPRFSWGVAENGVDVTIPPSHGAITVLRDPVDRVWSMFRFQTKGCFKCMPLTDIYDMMDAGNFSQLEPTCYQQLQNHQVANLLSSEWFQDYNVSANVAPEDGKDDTSDARVAEAIENMQSFFTLIGLTEQLDTTIEIAAQVFPWMKPQVDWSDRQCSLSHANQSPRNNGCGPNHSHWDLPNHPDEKTRAAIEAHNQLDIKLYAAALEHFELQKRAAGFDGK